MIRVEQSVGPSDIIGVNLKLPADTKQGIPCLNNVTGIVVVILTPGGWRGVCGWHNNYL
jgi:hypothetical protein